MRNVVEEVTVHVSLSQPPTAAMPGAKGRLRFGLCLVLSLGLGCSRLLLLRDQGRLDDR